MSYQFYRTVFNLKVLLNVLAQKMYETVFLEFTKVLYGRLIVFLCYFFFLYTAFTISVPVFILHSYRQLLLGNGEISTKTVFLFRRTLRADSRLQQQKSFKNTLTNFSTMHIQTCIIFRFRYSDISIIINPIKYYLTQVEGIF